jgi:alpha-beta hydrolase superfamily lysophospholipase
MDLQGFGRSGGVRGDARGIRPFTEDLAFFLRQERAHDALLAGSPLTFREGVPVPAAPPWPQVVLGHSFGGLVSLLALLWHPDALDGLILSSPALALRPLPPLLRWLQRVLFWTAPHRPLELPNDKSLVCSDPAMVEAYWADPLCHRFVTAAFVASLEEGRRELMPMGGELDRPVLLLESGQDTVVDPDGAQALWPAFRPGLLERHRLEAVRHEIFHDRLRAQAQTIAASWLDRTFPDPSGGTSSRLAGTLNQAPEGTP